MERQPSRIPDELGRRAAPRRRLPARLLAGAVRGRVERAGLIAAAFAAIVLGHAGAARAAGASENERVDCDALLTPKDVADACHEKSLVRAKPETGELLDTGVCLRLFQDKHGRTIRMQVDSAGEDEMHTQAEEILREHGGDTDYATVGTTPLIGARWSDKSGAHTAVFTGPWRLEISAPRGKKGVACEAAPLGLLGDTAIRRLPAERPAK